MSGWMSLEERLCIPDDPLPQKVDMVIALGTDVSRDGLRPSPQSAVIVRQANRIYRSTYARHLLFSGGYHHPQYPANTEAQLMANFFESMFLIPGRCCSLLIETESWRTYQQADNILIMARELHCRNVAIVAQQWHSRRVRATFRKRWAGSGINLAVIKALAPYGPFGSQRRFDTFLQFVAWDTAGLVISKIKGYC